MIIRRSLILPVTIVLAGLNSAFPQGKVSLGSDIVWGRTNYNRVTVNLNIPSGKGLARFAQELPPGFEVVGESTMGGDLYVANNTLYIVWVKPLQSAAAEISYFVRPPSSSRDNMVLEGTLAYISDTGARVVIKAAPLDISIRSGGGLTASQVESLRERKAGGQQSPEINNQQDKVLANPVITPEPAPSAASSVPLSKTDNTEIIYRVQVLTSSSELTISQLRQRTGINLPGELLVVRSGNLFKHQVGKSSDYQSAVDLKDRVVLAGLKGAFVVAWVNGEQVTIEQALKASSKN